MSRSIAAWPLPAGAWRARHQAVGQVGDRLLEALRDSREVLLVAGDLRRVGLEGEVVRRSNALVVRGFTYSVPIWGSWPQIHVVAASRMLTLSRRFWPWRSDSAAPPGSCRKPPSALYVESGKEWVSPFPSASDVDAQPSRNRVVPRPASARVRAVPSAQEDHPTADGPWAPPVSTREATEEEGRLPQAWASRASD